MTKRALHKLFRGVLTKTKVDSAGCKIESVRLRGAVPTTGGTSKQAKKRSSIQHEFAGISSRSSLNLLHFQVDSRTVMSTWNALY